MSENENTDYIVPVISEELHADAVPVETGSVRVVKRVESHPEVLEQELRKERVEVKRLRTARVVDGPQQPQRVGNTLIVPVVSEVLKIEKQWVVTEEIHITQIEEREQFQQTVEVNREVASVERINSAGEVISSLKDNLGDQSSRLAGTPTALTESAAAATGNARRVLTRRDSIIKPK